ncbi:hypothetical protein [Solidesulfovibrio magneticus]|uniref:Uncharacterized protein n=1 Tax=Solidesulfovibrio magneticus (strain ATCC 700980 / DSM 13731 / RS-1) TaxID=573370 RepID=C4XLJ2_SOLM1|nr:hypothetical protein [Solidesulfovibrio magneticus]BAH74586.1 hypothetical protein DMR_10950 [Solidesulfovibrio magneticus RS-1]
MGLEIGWYLRLSRARELEFLVSPKARPVLEDQLFTVSGWSLDVAEAEGFLRAVYRRLAPTK